MSDPEFGPNPKKLIFLAVLPVLGLLIPGVVAAIFVLGEQSIGDVAMDRSPTAAALPPGQPVHPPRGERTKVRSSKALEMSSESVACLGGSVAKANVKIQVTAEFGALVKPGCSLSFVNVDLVAPNGVLLEGGSLNMQGGSIEVQGTGIAAKGDATVSLANVTVKGRDGILASGTSQVMIAGGSLTGSQNAVRATEQSNVAISGADVTGPIRKNGGGAVQRVGGTYQQTPIAEEVP